MNFFIDYAWIHVLYCNYNYNGFLDITIGLECDTLKQIIRNERLADAQRSISEQNISTKKKMKMIKEQYKLIEAQTIKYEPKKYQY